MIAYEEALLHATRHIQEIPPLEDCVWILRDGKQAENAWYFDYALEPLPGKECPIVAGAPGFLVLHNGDIRTVSWSELRKLMTHDT